MVTSIARQSVILKCNMQKSVLTGNYEFYYAAGLYAKLAGMDLPEEITPRELKELLLSETKDKKPQEEREAYLLSMLLGYKPEETCDGQMKELLRWGKTEEHLWTVVIPS